ncbi:hypothetical protein C0674_06660 [Sporolactobacillus terrae]|uniref:Uncharacterized protein n=1 Tax=Sporolactobacillus terrae TaxID=269673 RepID=A0A410D890_9BACL|nr:hypothetical protein C0674_06660 [Sporolactobacillus terrae]QAA25302.1 hypothetical protein C0679_06645 [Sporolactobacillus terrae]BBN98641.1 hypothetical protein St703_13460 [Sporolactobacillus terrae]
MQDQRAKEGTLGNGVYAEALGLYFFSETDIIYVSGVFADGTDVTEAHNRTEENLDWRII